MAARKKPTHSELVRDRISASLLIRRLQGYCLGKTERVRLPGKDEHGKYLYEERVIQLEPHQVSAIATLLDRVLPKLQSIEHSGDVKTTYVVEMPAAYPDTQAWAKAHRPPPLP